MGELDASGSSAAQPPTAADLDQFVASGRTGRRNAMADLCAAMDIDPGAYKLSEQMSQLETGCGEEENREGPGSSSNSGGQNSDVPSTSKS